MDLVRDKILPFLIPSTSGCLEWQRGVDDFGYGMISVKRRTIRIHRAMWEFKNGPIPAKGCVLHSCDNPKCGNPDHLFLGSKRDNLFDMVGKDRHAKGDSIGTSKLNKGQVLEIRATEKRYGSDAFLARKFNVSVRSIREVVSGRSWKHLLQDK